MFRLLLVAAVVCCAQSHAVTSQHPQLLQALGDATKALQAAEQNLEEALGQTWPSPALTSVSVVQDWSLVCKELCGAGLGVAPCAEQCATSGVKMIAILNKDFDLVEGTQLQGSQPVEDVDAYGARLCRSFCHQRQRALNGCSPCQLLDVLDGARTEQSVTTHGSGAGAGAAASGVRRAAMLPKAITEDDGTPDWDEVCKTLCKTGDGGSLCNCDLSPFFHLS
ncbi:PREDICTED: uncharacterized protein LOC108613404 [Drosophila arizonae]|uniref:Uncharacterized protein LOC108613404 n=1 Tax=Drosophila arizonae TaxID=7263 RepID=A0ABM1P547_DROAR|nr:PREDICTED: uncharacterized protein LOC108613404 [Drosophila arizonae]